MRKTLSKALIFLVLFSLILFTTSSTIMAQPISIDNEHTTINNKEGEYQFTIIVPASEDLYENQFESNDTETQLLVSGVLVNAFIYITTGLGVCEIIEFVSVGWNPCIVARDQLYQFLANGPYGYQPTNYFVSRTFVSGSIPGCVPMHSYQCNSGYYEYTFTYQP